jgi:hypothetical protein
MSKTEWYKFRNNEYPGVFFKIAENKNQILLGGINFSQWVDKFLVVKVESEAGDEI